MLNSFDATVLDVKMWGSFLKGNEYEGSDLDFLLEYEGSEREDDMFNLLNNEDNRLYFEGVSVDINPIRLDKSGTIDEMLQGRGY